MSNSVPAPVAPRGVRILISIAILAMLTALLTAAGGAGRAFADGGTASVSGTVTASDTSNPISDVSVQLTSQDGSYFDSATTGDDGTYSFATIPAGSYTLTFQPDQTTNYLIQWWNDKNSQETPTYFSVADGQVLTGFDAALQPGATISGTVDGADALGTGLAGVNVNVQSTDGLYSGQAQTDADGNYTVIALPADAYNIDFQPSDGIHVEQWWNNKPSLATANFVTVGDAGSASGINAHLAVGATISGTVDAAGSPNTPLEGATVTAFGPGSLTIQSATTDADGNYTITGLPDAAYTVEFQGPDGSNYGTEYWQNANAPATATLVSVSGSSSASGINEVLSAGATVEGHVYAPGTPKVGLADVSVSVFSTNGGGPLDVSAVTNKNGHYKVSGLAAGSYSVQFFPSQGSNAAMEWWGGTFIQTGAKTVAVTTGQTVMHISQQLITGSAISGTVSDAGTPTTPDGNVTVLLWASDQTVGAQDTPPLQTNTDSSGNYSFPNIGPGTYTLDFAASEPAFLGQWWKDKPTQAKATALVVTRSHDDTNINATLAPAVITPGTPTITGHARVGSTLTAKTGSWKPKSVLFSFQWLRNGVVIPGEDKSTYLVGAADVGATLSVAVTGEIPAFESQGATTTITSAPTKVVTN